MPRRGPAGGSVRANRAGLRLLPVWKRWAKHLEAERRAHLVPFRKLDIWRLELRDDLEDDSVADLIWATNSREYFMLLTSRGWTTERYSNHLIDLWPRLLLQSP